ncbi:MAG: T9SS type A sorting domain-containing protein [Flavobacteriales bacterium]
MRASLVIIMLLIETLVNGQGFNKRYDAFGWEFGQTAFGIERVEDGYLVISGSDDYDSIAPGESFFHASVLLTRVNEAGVLLWEKRSWRPEHSAFAGWANCCDTIPGAGYIVGGSSEDTLGNDEIYLMRFDANGDTLWTRVFGDPGLTYYWGGRQVKRTADGGFLIVGDTQTGGVDGFGLKTDSMGNEEWRRNYGWSTSQIDALLSSDHAPDDTYYMAGTRYLDDSNRDLWVQRTDTLGEVIWRVSWGGPYDDGSGHLTTLSDGNALIANAHGFSADGTMFKPALTKVDATDGSIVWDRPYGPVTLNTVLFAAKETSGGDLIACGVSYYDGQQGLLLRTTAVGDSLWMRRYYYQDSLVTTGQGRFYDVLPTDDGGFIAAGAAYYPVSGPNPPGYSQDTWVVKVDGQGCIIPGCDAVGITEQATNLLGAITLFPNPAHDQVTVRLELPASAAGAALQLSLIAADGRVVKQEIIANGAGSFILSLANVSPGLYTVHITNGTTWLTGAKLVVE